MPEHMLRKKPRSYGKGEKKKKSEELSDTVIYLDLFDAPAQSMTIFLL